MVPIPKGYNGKPPMTPKQYKSTKNTNARKSLRKFSETMDVKYNTYVCRSVTLKTNRKDIRTGYTFWSKFKIIVVMQKINHKVR